MNMFYAFCWTAHGAWRDGTVSVAATSRGVAALDLDAPAAEFAAHLVRRGLVADPDRAGARAAALARAALGAALAVLDPAPAGTRTDESHPGADLADLPIDLGDRPAWDRLVLGAVRAIPRGQTAGYGEIARRIGRPGAARAVGGAVGRNPLGLLVPCHRVIAGDGTLGGYGIAAWGGREGALARKRQLLALEGVAVVGGRVQRPAGSGNGG